MDRDSNIYLLHGKLNAMNSIRVLIPFQIDDAGRFSALEEPVAPEDIMISRAMRREIEPNVSVGAS